VKPFFEAECRQIELRNELALWKGTRFWRHAAGQAKRGVGADCVSFVAGVMINVRAMGPIDWPTYVTFGGGHEMLERLVDTLGCIPGLWPVWERIGDKPELMAGDILLRSIGNDFHHLAVYAGDNTVWHILRHGVCTANAQDPFINNHLHSIWRFLE
jgi:hypothetical protein